MESLISGGENGELTIIDSEFDSNQVTDFLVIGHNVTILNSTFVDNNHRDDAGWGFWLLGDYSDIRNSKLLDGGYVLYFGAKETGISNSVIKRPQEHLYGLMEVVNMDLYLTNTTVYAHSTQINPDIDQPSHLWLKASRLFLANTVIADESVNQPNPVRPLVRLDSGSTFEQGSSSNYHVNDGSLPGAATGDPKLETPILYPIYFKPLEGSSLINAGDDRLAIFPGTNPPEPILNDVLGSTRIHGAAVDIGAVEVQANHAVSDTYNAYQDYPLNISAPGVLNNDIVFGTLTPDQIIIEVDPQHGTLVTDNLSGGFKYTPEAGFTGNDSFVYEFYTSEGKFSNQAVVNIAVIPPPPSRILVDKVAQPSGFPQSFHFTLTGGPDNANQVFSLTDIDAAHDSGELKAGSYSVTEAPAAGWATHSSCDDGSGTNAIDPASIDLAPGMNVTCTFTNVGLNSITVNQVSTPVGATGFGYSHDIPPGTAFNLDDGQSRHFDSVAPGTYMIAQTSSLPGHDLVSIDCVGAATQTVDLAQKKVTIILDSLDTSNCTFTNVLQTAPPPPGQIVVDLMTDPAETGDVFNFGLFGPTVSSGFSLTDSQLPRSSGGIPDGIYDLNSYSPEGWQLDGISCDDGSDAWHIDLQGGEVVTCTALQSLIPAPVIALEIVADPMPVAGVQAEYIITWQNNGNGDALGSQLSMAVPDGTSFVSASGGGAYNAATKRVTWNLGTIPAFSGAQSVTLLLMTDPGLKLIDSMATLTFNQDKVMIATHIAIAKLYQDIPSLGSIGTLMMILLLLGVGYFRLRQI